MQKNFNKNKNSFSHKSFDNNLLIKKRNNSNNKLINYKRINRSLDSYSMRQKIKNKINESLKSNNKNKKQSNNFKGIKNSKKYNKFVNHPLKIKTDNYSINNNKNNNTLNNSINNYVNQNRNKKSKLDYLKIKNIPNLTERLNTEKSKDTYTNSIYLFSESEKMKLMTIEKNKTKVSSLEKINKNNNLKNKNNYIQKRNSLQNYLMFINKGKKTQQNNTNKNNLTFCNEFNINEFESLQLRPKKFEGIIDIICISYKNLRDSILYIKKILEKKNILFLHTSPYIFKCSKDFKKFEIEICRIEGDIYYYYVKSKIKLDNVQKNLILNIFEYQ
jgi:hypothetical protein